VRENAAVRDVRAAAFGGGAVAGSGRVTLDDHGRHPGRRSLVAGDVQVITI
jgi:hypothetical protein